jgi:protocatechuate 4,5-dioxygenase alpha chain
MKPPTVEPPGFDLTEPGTVPFTNERALRGHALNQCALTLRVPANRQAFTQDPYGYMTRHGVSKAWQEAVMRRDWAALQRDGGHVQALSKYAAALGENLWHVGASHLGLSAEALIALCPRPVQGLPKELI